VLDQRNSLTPQRVLQTIADEPGNVLFHMRRLLTRRAMQIHGPCYCVGRRPLGFDHFYERNEKRRIPPMSAKRTLTPFQAGHDRSDRDDRGVAGEDRIDAGMGFDCGEQFLL
jgi:hypothetical protein